jgi:hypothetical protein
MIKLYRTGWRTSPRISASPLPSLFFVLDRAHSRVRAEPDRKAAAGSLCCLVPLTFRGHSRAGCSKRNTNYNSRVDSRSCPRMQQYPSQFDVGVTTMVLARESFRTPERLASRMGLRRVSIARQVTETGHNIGTGAGGCESSPRCRIGPPEIEDEVGSRAGDILYMYRH